MVSVAEWFRHMIVDHVYAGSIPVAHPEGKPPVDVA